MARMRSQYSTVCLNVSSHIRVTILRRSTVAKKGTTCIHVHACCISTRNKRKKERKKPQRPSRLTSHKINPNVSRSYRSGSSPCGKWCGVVSAPRAQGGLGNGPASHHCGIPTIPKILVRGLAHDWCSSQSRVLRQESGTR